MIKFIIESYFVCMSEGFFFSKQVRNVHFNGDLYSF